MRASASSNAGLFEKLGNPWVTQRQGLEDYGRNVSAENPDFDAFGGRGADGTVHLPIAGRAKERHEHRPEPRTTGRVRDDLLRAANANLKYQEKIRGMTSIVTDPILLEKIAAMRAKK